MYAKLTRERGQYIGGPVGRRSAESGRANLLPGYWADVGSFSRLRKGNVGLAVVCSAHAWLALLQSYQMFHRLDSYDSCAVWLFLKLFGHKVFL